MKKKNKNKLIEFADQLANQCDVEARDSYIYRLPYQSTVDNVTSRMWSRLADMIRNAAGIDSNGEED